MPLNAISEMSVRAVKDALNEDGVLLLLNRKDPKKAKPDPDDFHHVGIVGRIVESYEPNDGTIRIAIEGEGRAKVLRCFEEDGYLKAEVEMIPEATAPSKRAKSLMERAIDIFEKYLFKESQQFIPDSVLVQVDGDGIIFEVRPAATNTADKILEQIALMKTAINAFEKYIKSNRQPLPEFMLVEVKQDGTIVEKAQEGKATFPPDPKIGRFTDELYGHEEYKPFYATLRDFLQVKVKVTRQQAEAAAQATYKIQKLRKIDELGHLADSIASDINIRSDKLQRVLEEINPMKRLQLVAELLEAELDENRS